MISEEWNYLRDISEKILKRDIRNEQPFNTLKEILALVPKELKHKKDIPTVIEYLGRRYVLDHGNHK